MRILYLSAWFPYPPDSGAAIKTLSILNHLRQRHEITLVCLRRDEMTPKQSRWAADFGNVQSVHHNRGPGLITFARSYAARLPFGIERTRCQQMPNAVSEAMRAQTFDAVFVDGWLAAQYLPRDFHGLKLLHEHNAEHVIWRRLADRESNPLRSTLARLEARRVQRYETSLLPLFDSVFAVSEPDRQALIAIGADAERIHVLPNLPDPALLEMPARAFANSEPVVLYFGTLSWHPNIEGLSYFLGSVWPLVHERTPDARVVVAGKGATPSLERRVRETPGADFIGAIDDPQTLYRSARVAIETTRSGGGTKLKILNALARGLPVVATPEAVGGIEATPGQHLFVGDDPSSLADAIEFLLTDPALCQRLSETGRALIRERYVAEVAFTPLDDALSAGATAG